MRAIKHTLTERFYTWEDARRVAAEDPEIDLSGNGPAYTPKEYLEDEVLEAGDAAAVAGTPEGKVAEQRPTA